jgi:glutamyl endopeptidase
MRRSWTCSLAAATLVAGLAALPATAGGQTPEGSTATVQPLELSGPVVPVSGVSGHRPTAAPDAPAESEPADPGTIALGTESVIGRDDRERVNPTTTYPNSAVGQLEVTWRTAGGRAIGGLCTAFRIDDNSVLAAGHCAYDLNPGHGPLPHLIESGTFYPGRNRGVDPFGGCEVESAWGPSQYSVDGAAAFDFAVLNLAPDCAALGTQTGTFGLFTRAGSMARVKANVQGYPGDMEPRGTTRWFGTQKRAHGKIFRSQRRLVFYPMDTTGGQSGAPVWRARANGDCVGVCAMAVHAYGTDPQSTGVWHDNNAGIRLTPFRIGQILDIAAQND